jgi:hypothetical protein
MVMQVVQSRKEFFLYIVVDNINFLKNSHSILFACKSIIKYGFFLDNSSNWNEEQLF